VRTEHPEGQAGPCVNGPHLRRARVSGATRARLATRGGLDVRSGVMSLRLGSILLAALTLVVVPACSSTPQCVIDTDCPIADDSYCNNPPGGSGGSCVPRGTGGSDTGAHVDGGPPSDTGPRLDTGPVPDTGPLPDTGPMPDTGPRPDSGPLDAGHDAHA